MICDCCTKNIDCLEKGDKDNCSSFKSFCDNCGLGVDKKHNLIDCSVYGEVDKRNNDCKFKKYNYISSGDLRR